MFAVSIEFLEGRVIAARPDKPSQLEWPIEPARVFMALVAAFHEGQGSTAQRAALEWFESLEPNFIEAPAVFERSVLTIFVPVNDRVDDPTQRSKQPRTFPSGYVGSAPMLYYFDETIPQEHVDALQSLLRSVVRIGHSSSLVRCHLLVGDFQEHALGAQANQAQCVWRRSSTGNFDVGAKRSAMRVSSRGTLSRLERDYKGDAIEEYARLTEAILTATKKPDVTKAKNARDKLFPRQPTPTRPVFGVRSSYCLEELSHTTKRPLLTVFDPTVFPLAKIEGNALGLESTLIVTSAMRNLILKLFQQDAPAWVSGHETDGSKALAPHMAIIPLPFVGNKTFIQSDLEPGKNKRIQEYADGHLLGLGLVFPRTLADHEKAETLGDLLFDELGTSKEILLTLGRFGEWRLVREAREVAPRALTPETWSKASRYWASVSPIVLNRFPKKSKEEDLQAWTEEVNEIVSQSCEHIGLMRPVAVRILKHGPLVGVPSAKPDRSGFPLMKDLDGKARGIQVHAVLEFEAPVQGPVILGAGRFRGYGLCKPIEVH